MSSRLQPLAVHLNADSVDQIQLGVLRVRPDGMVTYANRTATRKFTEELAAERSLFDLDLEPASRQRLSSELAARKTAQRGSDYRVRARRRSDGTLLALHVAGVPEYDSNDEPIGSVAFVHDVTMETVNHSIHQAMGEARDWRDLLETLRRALHDVVSFDSLMITLVSADRHSLRALYDEHPMAEVAGNSWRWWPMPEMIKADLNDLKQARSDSVEAMFSQSPYKELKQSDEATRRWLECGYRHILRRPVMHNKRLEAILVAQRKEDRPFHEGDIARLDQLPIGEVVSMALALEREEDLRFGVRLMGHLGAASGSISSVARVLVEELRTHFNWPHVSLFRIDRDRGELLLMYQAADAQGRLPDGYRQRIEQGLLGEVARSGKAVRAVDARKHERYLEGVRTTVSELCVPVPGNPVRWILNAESPLSGAFAEEEVRIVEPLLEVAGLILDRTIALELKNYVLESMADAVFETSTDGVIKDVNKSCERLLGRSRNELIGMNIASLVSTPGDDPDPPGFAARFISARSIKPASLELLAASGEAISVVMSGNALPPEVGGNVYVATDLRFAEQVQRMDTLRAVFRQVASEIRVPLSLASAFVQQAVHGEVASQAADCLDKALQQLRKADLPLERVVRLAATPENAELPRDRVLMLEVARAIVDDLPEQQRKDVKIKATGSSDIAGAGSFPDLRFCASGILAFLLRMKAQRDRVILNVGGGNGQSWMTFELVDMRNNRPSETRFEQRSAHEREFALAEPVIVDLMTRMKGQFVAVPGKNLRIDLRLDTWVDA